MRIRERQGEGPDYTRPAPGAAAGPILHPCVATVSLRMLGHQRQTQTGSHTVAGSTPTGEALEDA